MQFEVWLTDDAVIDLDEIYEYIFRHDSPGRAEHVLVEIEKAFGSLCEFPYRGSFPKELLELGIREFREIFFKPYRIIYKVIEKKVYVFLIVDGRRDMQTLLQRRLLQA
ncbi:MAG: type II toxin-antitoxin system RelE/ParE family toxin [Candidatus Riflebacteria bacterium]|nr:type II toxin-antitoxin system RelE/ParE family toxin [Candidatus Riflebacteria bacterium]